MQQAIRVALLDSDPNVRSGRRMVLETSPNLEVVLDGRGEASEVSAVAEGLVDVLVLNQSLALGSGLLFYSQLRNQVGIKQAPACVITTAFDQPGLLLSSLEIGISHVVSIDQGSDTLLAAIEGANSRAEPFSLDKIRDLIYSENIERKLDIDLVRLVSQLPEKLASNLRRLRSVWAKDNSKLLQDFSLSNLEGLVARLPVRTAAELVIRLERSELLSER
jgi:DNA-binding NarL/FixJ family response regulator